MDPVVKEGVTDPWANFGGNRGLSGGKLFFGPPNKTFVFGGFPGEINFCWSPNIKIGVQGDLDYFPGQSLLVRGI